MCLNFSYPDSIRTRAQRFLRCSILTRLSSQLEVCFEPLTRNSALRVSWENCQWYCGTPPQLEQPEPAQGHGPELKLKSSDPHTVHPRAPGRWLWQHRGQFAQLER
jgi:hypothetical protein